MARLGSLICASSFVLLFGCKPVGPPAEDAPAAAETPAPGEPRTGWEPQEVAYPASPASIAKTDDVIKAAQDGDMPNILVIWGDDIGQSNISAYTMGLMGYRTPNIDRVAREGMTFTDYYGEQLLVDINALSASRSARHNIQYHAIGRLR